MLVFVSPTKNMKPRSLPVTKTLPEFCCEAETLLDILKTYNDETIMQVMKVNAKLALENMQRFQNIRFDTNGHSALSSYDGLAFQAMQIKDWDEDMLTFAQKYLRILSGFYGVVRPFDSIYPYRLEMQAKGLSERIDNLYSYWSDQLMQSLRRDNEDGIYINLASKEYAQAITPYLYKEERCIEIKFYIEKNGKRSIQATRAKIARGQMTAYIMKHRIQDPTALHAFSIDGWTYDEAASTPTTYVFVWKQSDVCPCQ